MNPSAAEVDIASASNPNFKRWLRLATQTRAVRQEGLTLAEGVHLLSALVESGRYPQGVVLRRGVTLHAEAQQALSRLPANLKRWVLAPTLFDQISPVDHGSGLICLIEPEQAPMPRALIQDMIVLDGVQDPGNAGSILRSAAAAGVKHVFALPGTAALWAPKVLRAGMGAHFCLALHEQVTIDALRHALDGHWVVAQAHGQMSLWDANLAGPAIGWIFGSEGAGPSVQAASLADLRITVPMLGAVESLNVGAAAAVCLFERARQRARR